MKTPFTTHGSLHRILVLAFAVALLFIGIGYANPLEELRDILTKDRSKKQNGLEPGTVVQPPQPELRPIPNNQQGLPQFRFPDQPKQKPAPVAAGITECPYRPLRRVLVDDDGNIIYMTFGGRSGYTKRLAANIDSPAGRAMLQILLSPPTSKHGSIAVAGSYPAGYDCTGVNVTTPALLLGIDRVGR